MCYVGGLISLYDGFDVFSLDALCFLILHRSRLDVLNDSKIRIATPNFGGEYLVMERREVCNPKAV